MLMTEDELLDMAIRALKALANEATGEMPDIRSISKWEAATAANYVLAILYGIRQEHMREL